METLRVQMEEKKAIKVRKKAMEIFGHRKGSISKAFEAAIDEWLKKVNKPTKRKYTAADFKGILKGAGKDAVELQHNAWKYWLKEE